MSLLFEQETYLLRRCFFEVQNEVGLGRHEQAYHRACVLWFEEHQVPVVSKLPHRLLLRGEVAHTLFPDFVGWDAICVELKSVPRCLGPTEFVQIFDYLKHRGDRVGLLVNMGMDRVQIERVAYDHPETEFVENWDSWTNHIEDEDRTIGLATRDALRAVAAEHGTGYGEEVLLKLALCALRQQGLAVTPNPVAKAFFRGVEIHESPLACLVVNERLVLVISSLFDTNEFNVNRARSYLKALNLNWGIAADFGKKRAEIIGIRQRR